MDISFFDPSERIKYRACHNWATCQSQCISPLGQDRVQGCGYEQKQQCGESANDDILLSCISPFVLEWIQNLLLRVFLYLPLVDGLVNMRMNNSDSDRSSDSVRKFKRMWKGKSSWQLADILDMMMMTILSLVQIIAHAACPTAYGTIDVK